ncbi:MAG: hypothetical protein Q4F06_08630 [Eubacteriales bacterium]|nr:hypothetical protein [Eubacteriales bacterium]
MKMLSMVRCEVDFYNIEGNMGDSYLPFIGFILFLFGMVLTAMGIVGYISLRKNFNIFFDKRDSVDISKEKYEKDKKKDIIMIVVGIVLMVASFIIL